MKFLFSLVLFTFSLNAFAQEIKRTDKDGEKRMNAVLFNTDDFWEGSKFIDSNFGVNVTFAPLNITSTPVYVNSTSTLSNSNNNSTSTGSAPITSNTFYGICLDLELYVLNNKFLYAKGIGSYHASYSNFYGNKISNTLNYNAYGAEVALGYEPLKLFAGQLTGDRISDYSFIDNSLANFSSEISGSADSNFKRRYAGIGYFFNDDSQERYIKFSVMNETNNYSHGIVRGFSLTARYFVDLSVEYFPKYPTAGSYKYTLTDDKSYSLWGVKIGKTFNALSGKY